VEQGRPDVRLSDTLIFRIAASIFQRLFLAIVVDLAVGFKPQNKPAHQRKSAHEAVHFQL
jgi:hypothetical protein